MEQEHEVLKPAESEQPEAGFVPYASEAEAAPNSRGKIKVIIAAVTAALVLVLFIVLAVGKQHNFYSQTVSSLQFDYRDGEAVDEYSSMEKGVLAKALFEQISGKDYVFHTVMYSMTDSGEMDTIVTEYDYRHTQSQDIIKSCSGMAGTLAKKKLTEEIPLGSSMTADSSPSLMLKEFFFGSADHGVFTFSPYDAYSTAVGNMQYTCEIWLMCDQRGAQPVYYTLYRYYSGSQLAAVRVLNDQDTLMDIYEIKDFSIS